MQGMCCDKRVKSEGTEPVPGRHRTDHGAILGPTRKDADGVAPLHRVIASDPATTTGRSVRETPPYALREGLSSQ
jgi:hypothetical protein